jgi:hypothetical protein
MKPYVKSLSMVGKEIHEVVLGLPNKNSVIKVPRLLNQTKNIVEQYVKDRPRMTLKRQQQIEKNLGIHAVGILNLRLYAKPHYKIIGTSYFKQVSSLLAYIRRVREEATCYVI